MWNNVQFVVMLNCVIPVAFYKRLISKHSKQYIVWLCDMIPLSTWRSRSGGWTNAVLCVKRMKDELHDNGSCLLQSGFYYLLLPLVNNINIVWVSVALMTTD